MGVWLLFEEGLPYNFEYNLILGWPKNSFGFFKRVQEKPNELFGQPN